MHEREWERVYRDAIMDAVALGASQTSGPAINRRVKVLRDELRKMYDLVEQAWKDGYERRIEDELHGTRTQFEDTDWRERCMK